MKLAEALNIRADLKKRILQLKERLLRNLKFKKGKSHLKILKIYY